MTQRTFLSVLLLSLSLSTLLWSEPKAWICSSDKNGFVMGASPCLKVMGRALPGSESGALGAAHALIFDWPGVVIEARFTGRSLSLQLASREVHLEACVDGECQRIHVKGEMKEYPIAQNLKKGEHLLRLSKLSETIESQVELGGFLLEKGGALLPTEVASSRQIEVIGDSYTVGYGVESVGEDGLPGVDGRTCNDEKLLRTTNTQRAQGAIAAQLLSADYQINAFSGLGIVRAYNGSKDFSPFPHYYKRVLMNRESPKYNPQRPPFGLPWRPQVVVVALGTNDFSTPLQPHESTLFADRESLRNQFRHRYAQFLDLLREQYPGVRFALVSTNVGEEDELKEALALLLEEQEKAGHRDLFTVDLSTLTLYGCHWHPDLIDQKRNGKKLAEAIAQEMKWELPKKD